MGVRIKYKVGFVGEIIVDIEVLMSFWGINVIFKGWWLLLSFVCVVKLYVILFFNFVFVKVFINVFYM